MNSHQKYVISVLLLCYHAFLVSAEGSPLMVMGLESGELVRCQYENTTDCTNLYEQDSAINSFEVLGEFIYFGLKSGELRRCPLPHPDHTPAPHIGNCTTFHQLESEINGLSISGKYIYAATVQGITRCGLRLSEDCDKFYETDTTVYSLTTFGNRVFAGLYDSAITCPLDNPNNCTVGFNSSSTVGALAASGKYLYVGLSDSVQMCELRELSDCYTLFETKSSVKALDVFNNHVHATLETGDIVRYEFDTNATTTLAKKDGALSVFTTFDTKKLVKHYRGESTSCTWQFMDCPPYIVYYDIESRFQLELTVKNNKLYYAARNKIFDTRKASFSHSGRKAIFTMDPAGRIYASNTHPILLIHHSSLMNGMPASAAGEMDVRDGEIESITTCSGHYRPSVKLVEQVTSSLKRQGYEKPIKVVDCGLGELYIDLDYQKTDLYYKAVRDEYALKLKNKKHVEK